MKTGNIIIGCGVAGVVFPALYRFWGHMDVVWLLGIEAAASFVILVGAWARANDHD